ncbi:hypothetical protein H310_09724 [Aphanomyces invadans]|uniref:Uncharacterized protein n=1 Tax=Aphanomyces invadans TaxID=157072 RepID=A0A024TTE5_9STRA|nr:hypothetical protein H310_09724 [Aphanomyces invadans]ETV97390.1 hypothetical protein H310_09724 [Aphanomyces invadans]|eukprot:XP_008874098.1 hypothetical protein H310_09724 [Aphanomyces invadans]
MGSLGFLTPFEFLHAECSGGYEGPNYKGVPSLVICLKVMRACFVQQALITLRQITWNGSNVSDSIYRCHRLLCTIIRKQMSLEPAIPPVHALNEVVVVDRGVGAALAELVCFCEDIELTKISADGIIIAYLTGSIAYSLSAGGSIAHP